MKATTRARVPTPPPRHLQLLASLAMPTAVVFGIITIWLGGSSLLSVRLLLVGSGTALRTAPLAVVLPLLLGVACAVVAGSITYRLAVEVPRVVRGWEEALAERTQALER